jgi:dihydroorotate dehydrogenase electron transfer subunit
LPEIRALETARVISTKEIAEMTFLTKFHSPKIASAVKPGQFVMISFTNSLDPLLARAFSVSDVQGDNLSLLYTAVGKGTMRLSRATKGTPILINGPLGNGFPKPSKGEKVWVVVGGSGAALVPIIYRTSKRAGALIRVFYGCGTKSQLVSFTKIRCYHATEDGSKGYHGTVVELLMKHLEHEEPDKIFGCGSTAMLTALQRCVGVDHQIFVSVETPMACGMGFCQGCPVKIRHSSEYLLACKDGPVFNAREIELE